jgi:hypothetical protein
VPDLGQGVILGAQADGEGAGAGGRHDRGGQVDYSSLDGETMFGERLGNPAGRLVLLESQLGVRLDPMAQVDQGIGGRLDRAPRSLLQCVDLGHPWPPSL